MLQVDLQVYGYDSNESRIFNYLLNHVNRVSAKEIIETLNLPPKTCYAALKKLTDDNIIETFEDEYPKLFTVCDPHLKLSHLAQTLVEQHQTRIRMIKTELDKAKTIYLNQFLKGSCTKQVNFYYFRNNSAEAKEFVEEHLRSAQSEILLNLVPSRILRQNQYLEILNEAANREVWVGIYLENTDLGIIPELTKQIKVFCVDSSKQWYISVDNRLYNNAEIILDQKRLISLAYNPNGDDLTLSSFIDFNTVQNIKQSILGQELKDARKMYYDLQDKLKSDLVQYLKENGDLSKQELTELMQISGKKLNELLKDLEMVGLIRIQKHSSGQGRPQERVSAIVARE
ncbi:MAG: helix-turn-helix domain-containing protein [Candidatus Hodarchaeota archaeon]